jgi:hypothetical protein
LAALTSVCCTVVLVTAERVEIEEWINRSRPDDLRPPSTNLAMRPELVPNTNLKILIHTYCEKHEIELPPAAAPKKADQVNAPEQT